MLKAFAMMALHAFGAEPNAAGIASAGAAVVVVLLVIAWSANAPVPPSSHPSALPE